MLFLKVYYRFIGAFIKVFYKLLFGKEFQYGKKFHMRAHFHVTVENQGRIIIGDNCFFNNDCAVHCRKQITIGDNCIFGENVRIYDHNHNYKDRDKLIKD